MKVFGMLATGWRRFFRIPRMLFESCQAGVLGENEEERHEFGQGEGAAKHTHVLGGQGYCYIRGYGVQCGGQAIE